MQNDVAGQLTPHRKLSSDAPVSGEVTMLHAVPFHSSTRVCSTKLLLKVYPAAMQNDALTQLTEVRSLDTPLTSGELTMLHAAPFHFSMTAWSGSPFVCV